ncbi:MAG: hypothetical protein N4A76_04435 [Firmicutes bacterium]|jgi:hypothetical protein|nr:hypothetical protein [Bacillota bacterium]
MGYVIFNEKITSVVEYKVEVLVDIEIKDIAQTKVEIDNIMISSDDKIILCSSIIGPGTACNIYVNNNESYTKYYSQVFQSTLTSSKSSKHNDSRFIQHSGMISFSRTDLKLTSDGYFVYKSNNIRNAGDSNIQVEEWYGTSIFKIDCINKMTISSSTINGMGIGSRFTVYKIGGGK